MRSPKVDDIAAELMRQGRNRNRRTDLTRKTGSKQALNWSLSRDAG
jgi:hypothetical protein